MPHRTVLLLGLTAALLLAGCAQDTPPVSAPVVPPVERPTPGPLWAYLDQVDPRAAAQAHQERTRACAADALFSYWPDDPNNELSQDTLPFAREWGYGGLSLRTATAAEQNATYSRTLSAPERERYDAVVADCAGAPAQEPDSQWQDDPDFAALAESFTEWALAAIDDPRVHEADAPWSACMAQAGYEVGSPDEAEEQAAAADPGGTWADPEVQEAEIALAVADLTCRASTGYETSTRAAWHVLQQEFVDAHRDQLDALVTTHGL